MKRNLLRVVCNPYTSTMSYYFKNEIGEWNVLSGNSPLSRQYYTNTSVQERSKDILSIIDEIYNRKNKGVDILFEGTIENFNIFSNTIKNEFAERDIKCTLGTTKIAVLGKKASGKTTLIESLEDFKGFKYSKVLRNGFVVYSDECNHANWYEIQGIDLGKDEIEKAYRTVKELSKENLSVVIYCISSISGRIEDIERELIKRIADDFSELKVMIALTMCYKDEEEVQESIDEIEKITNQLKIVPVLAKGYTTALRGKDGNIIVIEPAGLDMLSQYVFEER